MRLCAFTDEISPEFEEAVRICAEEGIREVEIRSIYGKNVASLSAEDVACMRDVLGRHGVRVSCLGSPFGKCELEGDEYAQHLRMFDQLVDLAHAFGARLIRMFAFWVPGRARTPDQPIDLTAKLPRIAELLRGPTERAFQEGLVLSLENEEATYVGTCREARLLHDAVASPGLGVCWDAVNGWNAGEAIFPYGYEQVRGLINHVHVRDARPDPSDPSRYGEAARLGDGVVDWREALQRLRADGFDGCLSLETHLYFSDPDRWPKLRAATVHNARELRRLLLENEKASPDKPDPVERE